MSTVHSLFLASFWCETEGDLINQLRHIASKIENSSRPSKELVSRDIYLVLAAMNEPIKTIDSDGTIEYRLNGKLHRTDGPAAEYASGSKEWYINGERHRTDGPAAEWTDGYTEYEEWFINGKRHRTNGPAVERSDGYKEWWVDDIQITVGNQDYFRSKYPKLVDQFLASLGLRDEP